jgi:hypothetical protein
MKKQTADYKQIKGLVTDVNPTVNPGCPTFQNFSLTPIGKLTKRKGWSVLRNPLDVLTGNYTEPDRDYSNLSIDYSRLSTGVEGYPNTQVFHCKPHTVITNGVAVTYRDVLYHKLVNKDSTLWRVRYDSNNNIIDNLQISLVSGDAKQFEGVLKIKFIETNDMVLIIDANHVVTNGKKGYIWKYAYNKNSGQFDTDRIHNLMVFSSIYAEATQYTVLPPMITDINQTETTGLALGTYEYVVLPVYNTGTIGQFNKDSVNKPIKIELKLTGLQLQNHAKACVTLSVYSQYNPYITHYRVYRSKLNKTIHDDGAYFVCQIAKPNDLTNPGVLIPLKNSDSPLNITDMGTVEVGIADLSLGSRMEDIPFLNTYNASPALSFYETRKTLDFNVSCGCFAHNRLILGYGNKVYLSLLDKIDSIDGSLTWICPTATENENNVEVIEQIGNNVFVWLRNSGIYVMKPTNDADVPFNYELVSLTTGCDSLNSICVLENIAYFIFNNRLWAMNEYGQCKEISAAINTLLDDKNSTAEIILKPNASERYIKIMYRNTLDEAVNIDYYPVQDIFTEQTGDKDIYIRSGAIDGATGKEIATLTAKYDRYKLVNYEQVPEINEEWGVDIDGNIVKRNLTYTDTAIGDQKSVWNNYLANDFSGVRNYVVNGIMEKPFVFNSRVRFNSVILFGEGVIEMAYKVDNGSYGDYRTYTMVRTGTECPLNGVGSIHSIKIRHSANTDIDLDFIKVKWTAQTNVNISNNVDGGV